MERILVTFVGSNDPLRASTVVGEENAGPILTLVRAHEFEFIYLLATRSPEYQRRAEETAGLIETDAKRHGRACNVALLRLDIDDVIDYLEILRSLRPALRDMCAAHSEGEFFVSVTSGTPQMHACFLLTVASGEFPAHIYNVREERHVRSDRPPVAELDYSQPGFPIVRREAAHPVPEGPARERTAAILRDVGILGEDKALQTAVRRAVAFAPHDTPVLVGGETGTGKDLFARLVHRLSGRPADRFVAVSGANLGENLVESELFGHVKGAFTGATGPRDGRFKEADGGTLFLDEVGELPLTVQAKLLRVLEDGVVMPLGGAKPFKVNVRVIAATNRDLAVEVREKRFREDLFHRLEGGRIHLPPLRERRDDIGMLSQAILERVAQGRKSELKFTRAALAALRRHDWPGNVRELANTLQRSAQLVDGPQLDAGDIEFSASGAGAAPFAGLPQPHEGFDLKQWEKAANAEMKRRALDMANGNSAQAARLLGIKAQAMPKKAGARKQKPV